jgi:mitotic spindle assembly checkpoint protein MAD1
MNAEDLRARIKTLEYEIDSLTQEREVAALQHSTEIREAQSRAESEFRRAQVPNPAAVVHHK